MSKLVTWLAPLADDPTDRDRVDHRIQQLLEAVTAIGSGRDLQGVLSRIVKVAADLVDAEFGALGVMDASGEGLAQFVTVGMDNLLITNIGHFPSGRGVLGEVIRDARPLRLVDLTRHASSSGFPAHHPPMRSFLGVPLRVGDAVFGNLYLTEKRGGHPFTEEDEAVLTSLALAAGVAIQNARLYDESRRRGAWVDAGREISTALLSGTDREDVISLVVTRARAVLAADVTFLVFSDGARLRLEAASGTGAPQALPTLTDVLDQVMATGLPRDLTVRPAGETASLWGLAVPLGPHDRPGHGALVALWSRRPDTSPTHDLTAYAAQAAIALELADRRGDAERAALVQDRDRIGRDLHDMVIQRLFATGMQLQGAVRLIDSDPQVAQDRVNRAVDEVDETIRELRATIYGLQAPVVGRPSLRAQVLEVMDSGSEQLGFAPTLHLEGLLDTMVSPETAENLLATLREALSNAARHAHANLVEVLVAVRGDSLLVRVEDDGCGMPHDGVRRGLRNLAVRAERLGGMLRVTSVIGEGTTLLWRVPV